MPLTNRQILAHIDAALKTITVTDLGDSVLVAEQAARFVREVRLATRIVQQARVYQMTTPDRKIDRTGFTGRILSSGKDAAGDTQVPTAVKPQFATNTLTPKELVAVAGLEDDTLEDNIERDNLENTLVEIFGQAAGRDIEEFAVFADSDVAFATDDVLSLTDGWIDRAAQKVYGQDVVGQIARDFDPDDAAFPENMFEAMLLAMPEEFLADPSSLRFFVDWDTQNKYRDLLKARGTALGDTAQTGNAPLFYKGIPVIYVPLFSRAPDHGGATEDDLVEGRVSLLVNPANLAWGIRRQMRIEPDRMVKERRTDFVLTLRVDADYEDENGAVAALIDKANPTLE